MNNMPTTRKKPEIIPDREPSGGNEQTSLAKKRSFKPRRIKPTDHAKYYIVRQSGKHDIILPLDANENRRQRQLDAAEYRGLLKEYIGQKHKNKQIDKMKPTEVKQLGEALKIADELDRMAWQNDIPLKPRTGSMDDMEELLEKAVTTGMKMKAKMQKNLKVIEAETTDVTGTEG